MRTNLTMLLLFFVLGCASVETDILANRDLNVQNFSSVGDVMLRLDLEEDLPNLWGRADVYGRTRDRGFSEIRYMGLSTSGNPVFRRRDVDVLTNEDTMNRMGFGSTIVTVQPSGSGATASGVSTRAPDAQIQALPADTTEFELSLDEGNVITMRNRIIEIVDARKNGVVFVVK